jgi:threonine aldolase
VYTLDELAALAAVCEEHGLTLHMDGSRLFNAAASLGCELGDLTRIGVDLLSLGGTKLGLMFGECVVVLNPAYAETVRFKQKQVMQLASKTRFIAAQFEAVLDDELWRTTALQANAMAMRLADGLKGFSQIQITRRVEANAVFATMPRHWIEPLQQSAPFYEWKESIGEVRLMCAWDTTQEDVEKFIRAVSDLPTTAL